MTKEKAPVGIVIHPHGMIETHKLKVESSLLWGEKEKGDVTFAWLTPSFFRNSNKHKYVLLPSLGLNAITLPGEDIVITSHQMIERVYRERYHFVVAFASSRNRLTTSLYLMIVVVVLILIMLAVLVALGLPQFLKNISEGGVI